MTFSQIFNYILDLIYPRRCPCCDDILPPGGVLATHSCSYHMPEDVFVSTVLSAAQDLHRRVQILDLRRQDSDHPVLAGYPESHYLKSLWLTMMN